MWGMHWVIAGILIAIFLAAWFVVVRLALRNPNQTSGAEFNPTDGKGAGGGGAGL
jgi:hypothetical protein